MTELTNAHTVPADVNDLDIQVLDFDAIFNAYNDATQKKWAHNRALTLGASEVFDCLRKGWFMKRGAEFGYTPDEDYTEDWGATKRGDLIENYHVVPAMEHLPAGMKLHGGGAGQETLVLGKNSATPDGIIDGIDPSKPLRVRGGDIDVLITPEELNGATCIVLEIKSIDPRATLVEERTKHHNQTQIQLGLIRELTHWKPSHSIVLYVNASFLSDMKPFVVEYNPEIYIVAKQRANDIWSVDDPLMVVPEGRFSGTCEHCRWRVACGTTTLKGIPDREDKIADPEVVEMLDPQVKLYFELKEAAEAAEKAFKAQGERLKEHLMDLGSRKVPGTEWSVTWYPMPGKKSLDRKAAEAAGIDLSPYEKEGLGFDVLRVTPKLPGKEKKSRKPSK
jgi:hypothetical protein